MTTTEVDRKRSRHESVQTRPAVRPRPLMTSMTWNQDKEHDLAGLRVTLQQVRELRGHHERGVGHKELAEMYGLTQEEVDLLCDG